MTPSTDHRLHDRPVVPDTPGDDLLLEAARDGEREAFAALRERYRGTALAVARARTDDSQEAERVASAALDRIEQIVSEGHGPHAFLGAFVVWMVGREADGGTGPVALPEEPTDPASVIRAFTRLPAQWQAFLWHTRIQGWSVRRASAVLGISAAAAGPLERDIRTGLRRAYRHAGAGLEAGAGCAQCREGLPGIVQGALPLERRREIQRHLDRCTACTAEYLRLLDPGTGLRTWMLPVLAGLPLWGAEAAGLAGLIRDADATAGDDQDVVESSRSGRGVKSLLGAGALVAAAAAGVVGVALTEDQVQHSERIAAGEAAPALQDPGSGTAGADGADESRAVAADEEWPEQQSAGPERERSVAARTRDDGWGSGKAAVGVVEVASRPRGGGGATDSTTADRTSHETADWAASAARGGTASLEPASVRPDARPGGPVAGPPATETGKSVPFGPGVASPVPPASGGSVQPAPGSGSGGSGSVQPAPGSGSGGSGSVQPAPGSGSGGSGSVQPAPGSGSGGSGSGGSGSAQPAPGSGSDIPTPEPSLFQPPSQPAYLLPANQLPGVEQSPGLAGTEGLLPPAVGELVPGDPAPGT